jgi:hypothetical protein
MSQHASIPLNEAAARLAIRQLMEANAHCADRRDALTGRRSARYRDGAKRRSRE